MTLKIVRLMAILFYPRIDIKIKNIFEAP
jgi:hypothetical protein